MKTNAIQPASITNNFYSIKNKSNQYIQQYSTNVYHPAYYKDYNVQINFKGGRNPEDFYEFNRGKMPATMEKYLNENYKERSKLAPVQVLREAYDDLSVASTVEDIKELYPNEEKFAKLKPANYKDAHSGILHKINTIKNMLDKEEPLFKDGCDDLTTYIVKKIYLEGKTAKEIDKDFARDINPIYELAAKIPENAVVGKNESAYFSHGTIYNLGIRFPKLDFWNSFISTREDYAQTKRIKTIDGRFVNIDSEEGRKEIARRNNAQAETPKPKKYNFDRKNVQKMSDTIANSKGDITKAVKYVKHNGRNDEELTFLQKYWSQIMSVVTEKIHLSEELIDFNLTRNKDKQVAKDTVERIINGIDFTKREKLPLQVFWNERADLKEHFSTAITDTILLFSDVYGANGENPEFKALVDYANNIKPNRELKKLEHERIQAEYDKLAEELRAEDLKKELEQKTEQLTKETAQVVESKINKIYPYKIDGVNISLPVDLKEHTKKLFGEEFILLPSKITSVFIDGLEKSVTDANKLWLTCCYGDESENPVIKKLVYSNDEINEIMNRQQNQMEEKYNTLLEASRNALFSYAKKYNLFTEEEIKKLYISDVMVVNNKLKEKVTDLTTAKQEIQNIFNDIRRPLSSKEKAAIRHDLFQALKKRDYTHSQLDENEKILQDVLFRLSETVNANEKIAKTYKDILGSDSLIDKMGGSLRLLLDKQVNPEIKKGIRLRSFIQFFSLFPQEVMATISYHTHYTNMPILHKNAENLVRNLGRR